MCTDDSRSSSLSPALLSYIDEVSIDAQHNVSPSSSISSLHHHHHLQQQQQHTPVLNEPALSNDKRPFDLHSDLQHYPATVHAQLPVAVATSPPPYWPAMTSHSDDCDCQRRRRQQQRQELRHDDVSDGVTLPIYAEKIVAELIDTERSYVAELQQIVQVFYRSTCLSLSVCLSLCLSVASIALSPRRKKGKIRLGPTSGVEFRPLARISGAGFWSVCHGWLGQPC